MAEAKGCRIDGCPRKVLARGLCATCYQRWWKNNSHEQRLRAPAGSGYVNSRGYREVYHDGCKRYEHRVVMEGSLGRPLYRDEQVHHINGDRSDNRLSNLELWTTSHPYGQRVEDKLKWAHELIERYTETATQ